MRIICIGLLTIAGEAVAQAPQGIRRWPGKAPGGLAVSGLSLAQLLKKGGYRTGLIGTILTIGITIAGPGPRISGKTKQRSRWPVSI